MWTFRPSGAADAGPPTPATFRNLCRSSPWKWQSLRFEYREEPGPQNVVRAWLRRPGALRLEDADGRLLQSTTGINDSRDGLYVSATRKSWLLPAHLVTPVYDDGGRVTRRPEAAYGEPCFGNGLFAAALDPVELAGNAPVPIEFPASNPVEVEELAEVELEGRPVWQATVTPTAYYRPVDPDSPLCLGRTVVRIDVETAVCVESRCLGDAAAGRGHHLRILGVDEYMLDDLFVAESMHLTDVRRHIVWGGDPAA